MPPTSVLTGLQHRDIALLKVARARTTTDTTTRTVMAQIETEMGTMDRTRRKVPRADENDQYSDTKIPRFSDLHIPSPREEGSY